MAHSQQLIAYVASSKARENVVRATRGTCAVSFCASENEFASAVVGTNVLLGVWETNATAASGADRISRTARDQSGPTPILVRIDPTNVTTRQIVRLSAQLERVHFSLIGHDSLEVDIARLLQRPGELSASPEIIRRVLPVASPRVAHIVVIGAIAGHRRISVEVFARLCHAPLRTLEWRLKVGHVTPARNLLGRMLSLHALWRLDVLGWTAKRVALASQFPWRESWASYITRHTGASPTNLLANGGFDRLLDECVDAIRSDDVLRGLRVL